jgi:hypothetical protein
MLTKGQSVVFRDYDPIEIQSPIAKRRAAIKSMIPEGDRLGRWTRKRGVVPQQRT